MSLIQEFYAGESILITGGTGFIGKILTAKLLRSCRNIGTIYLLVRPKKGKTSQERIEALFENSVFHVLRAECPQFANNVVGLAGDVESSELGLSAADRQRVINEVSIIFHAAASVRFDEEFNKAVSVNVNGVKHIIDIAKSCKNFKVGVCISTAFSNCVRERIDELIYASPISWEDVNQLTEIAERSNWTESVRQKFATAIVGEWPNTYTFTKAIAEGTVAEYAKDMPFAIFRPSIVVATNKEPVPGWVDNMIGIHGILAGMGIGVIRTMQVDGDAVVDLVPADMVCNALLACAWETATTDKSMRTMIRSVRPNFRHFEDIPVYNYVSRPENSITWKRFYNLCNDYSHTKPSYSAIYYNSVALVKSKLVFVILDFFLHLIPALLIDALCRLIGKQPTFHRLYKKINKMFGVVTFFCTREWDFRNHRVQNLWARLDQKDKELFPFSTKVLDWKEYMKILVNGIQKFLLKDKDEDLGKARQRHFILYVIHIAVRLIFVTFVIWITWKVTCGRTIPARVDGTRYE
ncbi:fatty acyl-CoA reductase wat-like isoform X1 [Neodiprion pinetum]|uniref:fatty acyl-CoA reductase wat-like isoform X1 n=1 Tax=Neodiprion pinetum TaxID=441929 RepID=UPI001EDD9A91|nr:fatty acyl-CoA reductase wat-like isoform X1 [Neodiprion pinetum]